MKVLCVNATLDAITGGGTAERTFQLVTQVAGRTGRGPKGGRVLVQTLSPDAPAIVAAVQHDLAAFAEKELPHREALGYPPELLGLLVGRLDSLVGDEIRGEVAEHRAAVARVSAAVAPVVGAPAGAAGIVAR